MAEGLSRQESDELLEVAESRFGDKDHFSEILLNNEGQIVGKLEDFADIGEHQNLVELAELKTSIEHNQPKNVVTTYYFGSEGNRPILGIFKSLEGENPFVHEEYHIDRFDVREVLAYEISEHFGFDLVPPTVHRKMNGQIGSLQLFIPQESYQTIEWIEQQSGQSHLDFAREAVDWEVMAVFDYIIGNPDRHARNVLVKYEHSSDDKIIPAEADYGVELIAIDNGTSFSTHGYYDHNVPLKGPNADLTYSLDEATPLEIGLPDYLLAMIKTGLKNRNNIDLSRYADVIDQRELAAMWQRAEDLVAKKVFLSRYNERTVFGY